MNRLSLGSLTIATTMGAMVATNPALAATLSYSSSYDPGAQTYHGITDQAVLNGGYGRTNINDSIIAVQQFDAALGTLTSVTLDFNAAAWQQVSYENLIAGSEADLAVDSTFNLSLKAADGTSLFDHSLSESDTAALTGFDGSIDFGGTSGNQFLTAVTGTYQDTLTFSDASVLEAFIGSGTLDYLFSANGTSKFSSSGGSVFSMVNSLAKARVNVTYEYEESVTQEVPEPGSLFGIAIASMFAGVLHQRRKTIVETAS